MKKQRKKRQRRHRLVVPEEGGGDLLIDLLTLPILGMPRMVNWVGGKFAEEDLSQTALPLTPFAIVGERRQELLERLAGALERATLTFPATLTVLLKQLRSMQTYRLTSGRYRVQVPRGEHDDDIFALALALSACAEASRSSPMGRGRPGARYAPTQAEVDGLEPSRSKGATWMRKRVSDRIRERAEAVGIKV